MITIGLEGLDKVKFQFLRWTNAVDDPMVEDAQFKVAKMMETHARMRVPKRTGALFKSIRAKRFSKKIKGKPAVLFAIDRRILGGGQEKLSSRAQPFWYQYMLEYGYRGTGHSRQLKRAAAGRAVRRSRASMNYPRKPFFEPAVSAVKPLYYPALRNAIKQALKRAEH